MADHNFVKGILEHAKSTYPVDVGNHCITLGDDGRLVLHVKLDGRFISLMIDDKDYDRVLGEVWFECVNFIEMVKNLDDVPEVDLTDP